MAATCLSHRKWQVIEARPQKGIYTIREQGGDTQLTILVNQMFVVGDVVRLLAVNEVRGMSLVRRGVELIWFSKEKGSKGPVPITIQEGVV